jgi:antitoxin component of MazEF toxin-antitoxin module
VAIPAALLKQAGIDIGSKVYFDIDQDNQAVIRIWPADHIASAAQ